MIDTVRETVTDLNPVADNIRKKDKAIIDCLVQNGFKKKDIANFVDVYKSDVKAYADVATQVQKAIKANKES
jgi:predicted XRE-type DNA-binding protein